MIALDTSIDELNKLGILSVRAMNVCHIAAIKTLEQLLTTNKLELSKVRNCGQKTLEEVDALREKYPISPIETIQEIEDSELDIALKKFELLSPSVTAILTGWIEWRFTKLSVRAKNAFPQLVNISILIPAIYSIAGIDTLSVKNCGKKTSAEIKFYLDDVKLHFEEATQDIDITSEVLPINDFDREVIELGQKYPFLLTKECESVIKFKRQNNTYPYLYIAKRYISRCDNLRISIHKDYYGLNPTFTRHNLSEIGKNNNLSSERVRQIVNQHLTLPQNLQEKVNQYLIPLIGNVVAFDSLLWDKIQRENMLEESYSQIALLVCALLDRHIIIQIDNNDKEYLVRKSVIENVKVRNVLNNIRRIIELKHATGKRLDILQYIKLEKRQYHKEVEQLCIVYANFIKHTYNAEIENNRYIIIHPNALDISLAIENILKQKDKPMSLDELLAAFNQLHPANAIDSISKFKSYIYRNPNIKPKGKSGIYILKNWKNHFTGTLTSYLEHILHTFNEPIPLDDLVEFALDEYPHTNKKSVYTLILRDKDKRFVIYEGKYVGLSNNMISNIDLKERKIIKRHTFCTRFEAFKEFVASRKRLPTLAGTDEEQSLARWMSNVLKSNIDSTEEQLGLLQTFLKENESLPQNATEHNFKQMCDQIKVLIHQTFELPDAINNQSEYQWLRKNLKQYASYEDNRKAYFEDLLSHLKDFGFYL